MNAHEILAEVRGLGARIEVRGGNLFVDAPEGLMTPELRGRLKENKAAILERLELEASMRRLEAASILLAISADGEHLRIVQTEAGAHQAALDGFTIYSPQDMLMYIALSESERRMLASFKRRYGGTTEWKETA